MRRRPRLPPPGAFSPTWRGPRDRKAAEENAGFWEGTPETAAGLELERFGGMVWVGRREGEPERRALPGEGSRLG